MGLGIKYYQQRLNLRLNFLLTPRHACCIISGGSDRLLLPVLVHSLATSTYYCEIIVTGIAGIVSCGCDDDIGRVDRVIGRSYTFWDDLYDGIFGDMNFVGVESAEVTGFDVVADASLVGVKQRRRAKKMMEDTCLAS